ncbi:helix-turn-helix protein [Amycolatopsis sulphurea]|uniref:Helix-turn-helix protein n=1 Tax=Amycolatopsis sulphurea TaxID=76022 RepID=A0A2A9FEL5_9PSEU|nr:helix-turn-helix domain-containing protein [Amycolatopsis sulphurea]PFG48869.1 helix-turn-helix protein [Amycolatopsis sulphurea]
MAKSWKEVKARKEQSDINAGRDVDTARAAASNRTALYVLGHRLGELREHTELTQQDVAERMGVSQPRVSKIEQGDPEVMEIETLRRYVAALGGHLRVVADFSDPASDAAGGETANEVGTLLAL